MNIYMICPVRQASELEKEETKRYVENLRERGHTVHYPPEDTKQDDPTGLDICMQNLAATEAADEIHVWWNHESNGSIFDLGMAFALRKKIVIANRATVSPDVGKSFTNVLLALHNIG